ncbi:Nucleolar protein 11 [Holothuria leucospilota]|uniref:Nucleolar protein 11 n=1 Tax=Holothuria leucospilota TaxID=206669 RepID=A0A9Q1C2B6_HOLLE|nr:Nucleolar protein 11 [Holothuria leucospilota]
MAEIQDGVTLFHAPKGEILIGVTSSPDGDEIIVTKARSVETYKVGDNKPLKSWSTRTSLPFTCPVVFNASSDEFVGVCNHSMHYGKRKNPIVRGGGQRSSGVTGRQTVKTLLTRYLKSLVKWTYETSDLCNQRHLQIGSKIQAILMTVGTSDPLIVFCNGSVENLTAVISKRKTPRASKIQENETILNQWLTPTGEMSAFLLTENLVTKEYSFMVVPECDMDQSSSSRKILQKPSAECVICDSCLYQNQTSPKLFVLWSDRSIWSYSLKDQLRRGNQTSETELEGNRVIQLSMKEDPSRVCITTVYDDYVAISGLCDINITNPTEEYEYLTMWNINFSTLQGHVTLPGSIQQGGDRQSRFLVQIQDHLLAASPQSLTCHSFTCQSGTLSNALGKLPPSAQETGENAMLSLQWTVDEDTSNVPTVTSAELITKKDRVLQMLLTPGKTNMTVFKKDVQHLHVHSSSSILEILKVASDHFSGKNDPIPRKLLEAIIKQTKVAGSACPWFLSLILEKSDVDLTLVCLDYMQDLPEPFIVKCLELFLRLDESKLSSLQLNGSSREVTSMKDCPVSTKQACCINKILVCPFNTIFLLSSVKKVQFGSVLIFLKYLEYLMTSESYLDDQNPSEDMLIDWISVTLDAHFTQLILTPEARDVLTNLQKCVKQHAEFYREVNTINQLLQAMKKTSVHGRKDSNVNADSYSIELLKL